MVALSNAEHSTLLDQLPLRLALIVLLQLLEARLQIYRTFLDKDPEAQIWRLHRDEIGDLVSPRLSLFVAQAGVWLSHHCLPLKRNTFVFSTILYKNNKNKININNNKNKDDSDNKFNDDISCCVAVAS